MMETYVLNDGARLPKIGFGTYNEEFKDNKASILKAIECGYRFFDTASLYETERSLGAAIKESGIARTDVIIETKLWIDEMGYENAKTAQWDTEEVSGEDAEALRKYKCLIYNELTAGASRSEAFFGVEME